MTEEDSWVRTLPAICACQREEYRGASTVWEPRSAIAFYLRRISETRRVRLSLNYAKTLPGLSAGGCLMVQPSRLLVRWH